MAIRAFLSCCLLPPLLVVLVIADFNSDVDLTYGGDRVKIKENGNLLELTLDKDSGSGIKSKQEYMYGVIDMQIKVVPGNSSGTVTAFYLSSQGPTHDEIDFEFLGNASGEPYVLHTNVYTQGIGDREQQIYLWFDPRQDFHNYSILWNPQLILFYVDGTPIRVFRNTQGLPYPRDQPMRLYSSLWNADGWATRGGRDKIDWTQAPFVASYRDFKADACIWSAGTSTCPSSNEKWWHHDLDSDDGAQKLKWVREKYMIYDYCLDTRRFPKAFPPECYFNRHVPSYLHSSFFDYVFEYFKLVGLWKYSM